MTAAETTDPLAHLDDDALEVIARMLPDEVYSFRRVANMLERPVPEARRRIYRLRDAGLVELSTAWDMDTGLLAGRGFGLTPKGEATVLRLMRTPHQDDTAGGDR